jgi:hypothetical protein
MALHLRCNQRLHQQRRPGERIAAARGWAVAPWCPTARASAGGGAKPAAAG